MSTPEPQRQRRTRHTKPRKPQSDLPMINSEEGATDHVMVSTQQPAPMSSTFPIPTNGAPQTPARKQSSRNIPNSEHRPRTEPKRDHSTSRKKRRPKPNHIPNESALTTEMTNNSPVPIMEPTATSTPRPVSQDPAEFYAGPTFHNSPAPSSLPVPKFLRKSTPKVPKVDGAGSASDDKSSESSTSPENSPMPRKALFQAEQQQQQKREESPLDIFFQADRQEKTAKLQGFPFQRTADAPGRFFRSEQTVRSPSPHGRSITEQQRLDNLFPGQDIPQQPSQLYRTGRIPPNDSPFSKHEGTVSGAPAPENGCVEPAVYGDELQRKTAELKKMLMDFEPSPSHDSINSTRAVHDKYATQSPVSVPQSRPQPQLGGPSRSSRDMRPRPTSSGLRREVVSDAPTEVPITSAPPPTHNFEHISPQPQQLPQAFDSSSQNYGMPSMPSHFSKQPTTAHSSNVPTRPFQHGASGSFNFGRNSPMRSMEDDLRRILKMEPSQDRILDVR